MLWVLFEFVWVSFTLIGCCSIDAAAYLCCIRLAVIYCACITIVWLIVVWFLLKLIVLCLFVLMLWVFLFVFAFCLFVGSVDFGKDYDCCFATFWLFSCDCCFWVFKFIVVILIFVTFYCFVCYLFALFCCAFYDFDYFVMFEDWLFC